MFLKDKVEGTVKEKKLLQEGDRVLAGVSGGADSVCLLHLLKEMEAPYKLEIHVFHLNHLTRGEESREDARFVQELALKMGLPFYCKTFDVPRYQRLAGLSLQEAARRVRLRAVVKRAQELKAGKIALGHNADDQAETIVMRILRGVGLEGLKGMEHRSPFPGKYQALIIRPLLEIFREEIEEYCQEQGLEFRIDPTNLKPLYLRNKVRLELIPYIEENYNPSFKEGLLQMSKNLSRDNDCLNKEVDEIYGKILDEEGEDTIALKLKELGKYHKALQVRVIRRALKSLKGDLKTIEGKHLKALLEMACPGEAHSSLSLPRGIRAEKSYDILTLIKGIEEREKGEEAPLKGKRILNIPGRTHIPELNLVIEGERIKRQELPWPPDPRREAYLDYERVKLPLYLALRWPGARFHPQGMEGTKKIKDFFMDEKISLKERRKIPLIISNGEILWVVGKRIAHPYRIREDTGEILVLRVYPLDDEAGEEL